MGKTEITEKLKDKLMDRLREAKTYDDLDSFVIYIMCIKKFKTNYSFYEILDVALQEYNCNQV